MYTLYLHVSPSNKYYIGITKNSTDIRWGKGGKNYLTKYKNGGYIHGLFAPAIVKYGWNNFKHEIIKDNLSREEANILEDQYIKYYKSKNQSYNLANGGIGDPGTLDLITELYDLNGNLIQIFDSCREAGRITNINAGHIGECCRQERKTAGGYFWKYQKSDKTYLEHLIKERYSKRIYRYNSVFELIEIFETFEEVVSKINISRQHLSKILNNHSRYKNEFYLYEKDIDALEVLNFLKEKYFSKFVYQFDINGCLISKYRNAAEASRITGITNITGCTGGIRNSAGGYIWISYPNLHTLKDRIDKAKNAGHNQYSNLIYANI